MKQLPIYLILHSGLTLQHQHSSKQSFKDKKQDQMNLSMTHFHVCLTTHASNLNKWERMK
jgi:hypothetical protein